jgi:hypothetical protein
MISSVGVNDAMPLSQNQNSMIKNDSQITLLEGEVIHEVQFT